ncbi:DNA translocase FtsK [Bacteroides sp. OF04-15BH]|uniref:FtsK/SpoIIIE family DNA translocase n=1 Tax=Bacteroides sp. OF04-15BH TaxID=2292281 RepID=UPI000E4DD0F6|nr:DNA translocase FtsK [Bacteroides sp. OF04-15BH]RHP63688.1 DNA translocase FtsK [Bacteroides sp. OF04-15BH]
MSKNNTTIQITKLGNKTSKNNSASGKKKNKNQTSANEQPNRQETFHFLAGSILLVISLLMLLSFSSHIFTGAEDQGLIEAHAHEGFANYAGSIGAYCADFWMNQCFGFAAFFIPIFLLAASMKLTKAYHIRLWKWFLHCAFLTFWVSISSSYFLDNLISRIPSWSFLNPGGHHGQYIVERLTQSAGSFGVFLIILLSALVYFIYLSKTTIIFVRKLLNPVDYIKSKIPQTPFKRGNSNSEDSAVNPTTETPEPVSPSPEKEEETEDTVPENETSTQATIDFDLTPTTSSKPVQTEPVVPKAPPSAVPVLKDTDIPLDIAETTQEETANSNGKGALEPFDPKLDLENYKYPVLELLNRYEETGSGIDMEEQNKNKDQIIEVLQNFGVGISSIKATVGPTITLYEITPAKGVRISKIKNLEDDIALSLSALGIRIIAPIPGKGTIGIEVPNARPQMVSMESILNSKKFQEADMELPIALGKTITNEVFMVDLAKMPHLLVAGATGQGKSVGLNAIITSLLYKKHPAELKFVMVDPKKVEFSIYSPIENHFLAKVADEPGEAIITDVNKVVQTLKSLCQEMDSRYDLLKKARARNLKEYNTKFKNRQLNPENGHRFMPYIVVVIDEFGDLIMTAGKEIELPIARIAQLARAVGIHMIIATQRPTTNIITGTIKANFPARMAFKVSSMIDSRTILDRPGANQLIGRGDMLFLSGSEPVRVQCAFVDTPEVEHIANYIAKQQSYAGPFELPRVEIEGEESTGNVDMGNLDPLFEEAAHMIVNTQQGSTSMIQRKFSIGYNRAGRLMDQLEKAGIVGSAQGSKPREVLCVDETDLEMRLNNLR